MMSQSTTPRQIDERFIRDWVAYGMLELVIYLDKHSRFDEYCADRDRAYED
jgi:hypothetical protein